MKYLAQSLLSLIMLISSTTLFAFPKANPVPGGVALVPLGSVQQPKPQAYFQNKAVTILPYYDHWLAVVGLPLELAPSTAVLQVQTAGQWANYPVTVKAKKYRTQRLRIRDKNKVTPNAASSQRIVREIALTDRLKQTFSDFVPNLNFIRPVSGRDTGRFGMRRIMNGVPRQPHSGMDIAAVTGTPIKTPHRGRVIYTGSLFYTGNTVILDHGQGVLSLYAHLNTIHTQVGKWLEQGEILGTVGKTGRATGPHLHWSIYLNQTSVDPSLFLNR
ncbi:M23 family metallopeptidase [Thiofilum flexile]|uniref:M23 family metallopeptidase n=1 Tax=Thiofilum flexile TaxID=125627 RepID=UPI0003600003|nr:M23 family metallopeptidase [Thiofilum flexile]